VITESEKLEGDASAEGDETVGYVDLPTVMEGREGLRGVTGSECNRYHANTAQSRPSSA
jgi:hypothetical protein